MHMTVYQFGLVVCLLDLLTATQSVVVSVGSYDGVYCLHRQCSSLTCLNKNEESKKGPIGTCLLHEMNLDYANLTVVGFNSNTTDFVTSTACLSKDPLFSPQVQLIIQANNAITRTISKDEFTKITSFVLKKRAVIVVGVGSPQQINTDIKDGKFCAYNQLVNHPYVIGVTALDKNNHAVEFASKCSAVLLGVETDNTEPCHGSHGLKTEAAAAVVVGEISQILLIYPSMTAMDVILTLVHSTDPDSRAPPNAAGVRVSYETGFGVFNKTKFRITAKQQNRTKLPQLISCTATFYWTSDMNTSEATLEETISSCQQSYVTTVQVKVFNMSAENFHHIVLSVESPQGTSSDLTGGCSSRHEHRPGQELHFKSFMFWKENFTSMAGWRLTISQFEEECWPVPLNNVILNGKLTITGYQDLPVTADVPTTPVEEPTTASQETNTSDSISTTSAIPATKGPASQWKTVVVVLVVFLVAGVLVLVVLPIISLCIIRARKKACCCFFTGRSSRNGENGSTRNSPAGNEGENMHLKESPHHPHGENGGTGENGSTRNNLTGNEGENMPLLEPSQEANGPPGHPGQAGTHVPIGPSGRQGQLESDRPSGHAEGPGNPGAAGQPGNREQDGQQENQAIELANDSSPARLALFPSSEDSPGGEAQSNEQNNANVKRESGMLPDESKGPSNTLLTGAGAATRGHVPGSPDSADTSVQQQTASENPRPRPSIPVSQDGVDGCGSNQTDSSSATPDLQQLQEGHPSQDSLVEALSDPANMEEVAEVNLAITDRT